MTKKVTIPKRSTNAPRYSSKDESDSSKTVEDVRTNHDSDDTNQDFTNVKTKSKLRAGQDDDNQRKHFKSNESKSKSKHTNRHIIGEYNAVIDVQLANTELLNALGIFEPVTDKISRYDNTSHQRSFKRTKPAHTKSRVMRALAEIKPKKTQRTARLKPSSRYLKPLSKFRNNISTLLLEESELIKQLMKDHKLKQKSPTRRNARTVVVKSFNEYVMKRLDILERDLQNLKHIHDLRQRIKKTDDVIVNNVTDKNTTKKRKDFKANVVRLANENKDFNNKENSTLNTELTTKNTTYSKPSVVDTDTGDFTVIDYKNTSQVTNNNLNDTMELTEDKIDNIETAVTVTSVRVTDATEPAVTAATAWAATRTLGPPIGDPYYEAYVGNSFLRQTQIDPFNHKHDGIDDNLAYYGKIN